MRRLPAAPIASCRPPPSPPRLPLHRLSALLAAATGLIVANLYYAQPLAGPIGRDLGISVELTGLIVALTQFGYGVGLLLLVPLGDLVENRRLVRGLLLMATSGLVVSALAPNAPTFFAAAILIGLGSVAVQVLVPYAAHMAPEDQRGRVIGNVTGGLMLGVMLARPFTSAVAEISSWRAPFWCSAAAMLALWLLLGRALPERAPTPGVGYRALLASMGRLAATMPVLQRRAIYHAFMFAAFSLFWTTVPIYLAGPAFGLSQGGIALFALAGASAAIATPLAGRIADRGWGGRATSLAMLAAATAFLVMLCAPHGTATGLAVMMAGAVLLDFGFGINLTVSQRAILSLGSADRARLNALFMATFFAGGALGSALGAWAYARGGWPLTAGIGIALTLACLPYQLTRDPDRRR